MNHRLIHLNQLYPLDTDPVLEVFQPTYFDFERKQQPLTRAIVVLPGGGYSFCSHREADPIACRFVSEGYCSFVLWYSTGRQFPTPYLELFACIDYLKEHAADLHINKEKIARIGFSAGGHLAGSYCSLWDDEARKAYLGIENHPVHVNALVLSYPVITRDKWTHLPTRQVITGGDPSLREKLSIEKHITKDYPPTFLWATKEDNVVPVVNSKRMDRALEKASVEHCCILYPHLGHGLSLGKKYLNYDIKGHEKDREEVSSWFDECLLFLDRVLD